MTGKKFYFEHCVLNIKCEAGAPKSDMTQSVPCAWLCVYLSHLILLTVSHIAYTLSHTLSPLGRWGNETQGSCYLPRDSQVVNNSVKMKTYVFCFGALLILPSHLPILLHLLSPSPWFLLIAMQSLTNLYYETCMVYFLLICVNCQPWIHGTSFQPT